MKQIKICIVRSKYNKTSHILKSATEELSKRKIYYKVFEVPGAFEIPVVIARNIKKFDGFIAVGSIIKGATPNFDFISSAITNAIMQLSILHKKPIGNALLTCLNEKQSILRANKGYEAAIAVSEVLNAK
ncbi:MAG: 6,7-dimethyl-8-ribityllumazine synthase [Proteobacteria bacterium]|jgi:6,7-dimethyl-8-ribityllumazine synthase|nr:6,7-dimethyl-8-ribityllumazine synthase [Pseudomonadota bacterium]